MSESEREQYLQLEQYFKSLPTSRFPNLVRLASTFFDLGGDRDGREVDRFQFGLDVLLSGQAVTKSNAAPPLAG
jgi:hypothetical protein